jgi:hypothetical protein
VIEYASGNKTHGQRSWRLAKGLPDFMQGKSPLLGYPSGSQLN